MKIMKLEEALATFHAQDVAENDYAAICPICGTVQSMRSLVRAGADPAGVNRSFAFSCEGRFSNAGPWPSTIDKGQNAEARRQVRGCDWTLGGLFKIHRLTIVYPDGKEKPSFEIATAEQAQLLAGTFPASSIRDSAP